MRLNKAFTLIEVLITSCILAGAVVFILRSFAVSLSANRLAQHISLACYIAEDNLWLQETVTGRRVSDMGREKIQGVEFNWKYEVNAAAADGLDEVKMVVSWKEGSQEKSLDFFTYLSIK